MKRRILISIILLAVSASLIGGVWAQVTFFSQSAPSTGGHGMAKNCTTLTPSISDVETNTTGAISFNCSGSIAAFTSKNVVGTPTFTLSTGYNDLYLYPSGGTIAVTCAATTGSISLTSGTGVTFPMTSTTYNYCADYHNPPITGLGNFTITWSG